MCITKTELEQKVQELRSLKAMKEELENEVKAVEHEVILYPIYDRTQSRFRNYRQCKNYL